MKNLFNLSQITRSYGIWNKLKSEKFKINPNIPVSH